MAIVDLGKVGLTQAEQDKLDHIKLFAGVPTGSAANGTIGIDTASTIPGIYKYQDSTSTWLDISEASTTAIYENGLTYNEINNKAKLGGALTGNTTITLGSYSLGITSTSGILTLGAIVFNPATSIVTITAKLQTAEEVTLSNTTIKLTGVLTRNDPPSSKTLYLDGNGLINWGSVNILASAVTDFPTAVGTIITNLKNIVNGIAGLDSGGKIPVSILPDISLVDVFIVNSEASMLALNSQQGDKAVRTDVSKTYQLKQAPATNGANWIELLSSGGSSGSADSFENGLGRLSGVVTLGGALTQSTTISGNDKPFSLGTNASRLNSLSIYSSTDITSLATGTISIEAAILDFKGGTLIKFNNYISLGQLDADPPAANNGSFYYNTVTGKNRHKEAGIWYDINATSAPVTTITLVNVNGSFFLNAGDLLDEVLIKSTVTINNVLFGTTDGGSQVGSVDECLANVTVPYLLPFMADSGTTIYVTGIVGTTATVTIKILKSRP
jgi:phage terminase large subunit-like protein